MQHNEWYDIIYYIFMHSVSIIIFPHPPIQVPLDYVVSEGTDTFSSVSRWYMAVVGHCNMYLIDHIVFLDPEIWTISDFLPIDSDLV
jgi:hypothetical protein